MDCNLPGSSARETFQARLLEWVAISWSQGSSQPRDWTAISVCPALQMNSLPLSHQEMLVEAEVYWTDEPVQLWQNKTWRRLLSIKSNSYCRIRESLHSTGKKQLLRAGGGRRELSKPIIASSHLPIRKVTAFPIGQSEWRAWRESGILHFPMKFHKEGNSLFS